MLNNEPSTIEAEKKAALTEILTLLKENTPERASLWQRSVAFSLDFSLICFLSLTVLGKWVLPQQYAQEWAKLQGVLYVANYSNQQFTELFKTLQNADFQKMVADLGFYLFLSFWAYFALSEIITKGGSLGKKIFRLTVVKINGLEPPSILDSIFRSSLKAFAIFSFLPICALNFLLAFFTKYRQAGHDFIARTVVVYEPSVEKPRDDEDKL
jgi:hypothetical protein